MREMLRKKRVPKAMNKIRNFGTLFYRFNAFAKVKDMVPERIPHAKASMTPWIPTSATIKPRGFLAPKLEAKF